LIGLIVIQTAAVDWLIDCNSAGYDSSSEEENDSGWEEVLVPRHGSSSVKKERGIKEQFSPFWNPNKNFPEF
jgi:hypothetical protein